MLICNAAVIDSCGSPEMDGGQLVRFNGACFSSWRVSLLRMAYLSASPAILSGPIMKTNTKACLNGAECFILLSTFHLF